MPLTFTLNLSNDGYIELTGDSAKYWEGYGLPTFEGNLEGLSVAHPLVMQELIDRGIILKD